MAQIGFQLLPAGFDREIREGLQRLEDRKILERIMNHDHTVWKEQPDEITNRLGWLSSPAVTQAALPEIYAFADDIRSNFKTVLLLGMGGSSLAPEVFGNIFPVKAGYPELLVLDTTDPDAIHTVEKRIDPGTTHFIVATKSGGTVETISLMKYFYNLIMDRKGSGNTGTHFSAITDPGSGLEEQARSLGFRKIFLNDPDIGGRYSALSFFGMVPAALIGVDIKEILREASDFSKSLFSGTDRSAAVLGTMMGVLADSGVNKITLRGDAHWAHIGPWIEQLIAESTGKEGKGILPVDREPLEESNIYGRDRIFVFIAEDPAQVDERIIGRLNEEGHPVIVLHAGDPAKIGAQFFLWEMATIIAAHFLEINPFDQPNVESAKVKAKNIMEKFRQTGELGLPDTVYTDANIDVFGGKKQAGRKGMITQFLEHTLDTGGYAAVQAYMSPEKETDRVLMDLCSRIRKNFRVPATLGYGPRFLHSTGQLHKGDAGKGVFIQLLNIPETDRSIPDHAGEKSSAISFGNLRNAQAFGDREALLSAGRKVLTILIKQDMETILTIL